MKKQQIQVNVRKIIDMMGKNLYSNPDTFLREMIQNACDGINKRRLELRSGEQFKGAIHILLNPGKGTMHISDNGAGLDEDEIRQNLATIGGSDKESLNAQITKLQEAGDHTLFKMIGQFGVGLYSCFIVADMVELTTMGASGKAWLWENSGDLDYTLQPADMQDRGTTAILHLKDDQHRYLDEEFIGKTIKHYADIIGVPIYLNDSFKPINRISAPWHQPSANNWDGNQKNLDKYWEDTVGCLSLGIFPVDHQFTYNNHETGEKKAAAVRGILSINHSSSHENNSRGLRIYISRMLVNPQVKNILPSWANFVSGTIECDALQPNASREDIVANGIIADLRHALGKRIIAYLIHLAKNNRPQFTQIMHTHGYNFLQICEDPKNEKLVGYVSDLYLFSTLWGEMTLSDYIGNSPWSEENKPILYYFTEESNQAQIEMLSKAKKIDAVILHREWEKRLFLKCARQFGNQVEIKKIDSINRDLFDEISENDANLFNNLLRTFRKELITTKVRLEIMRFEPESMPAMFCPATQSEEKDFEDIDMDENEFEQNFFKRIVNQPRHTLILNTANPLLRKMTTERQMDNEKNSLIIRAIFGNAMLLHSQSLSEDSIKEIFENHNAMMLMLLAGKEADDKTTEDDFDGMRPINYGVVN